MKDFKKPTLYKLEQGTFETFVDSMLETNTEYNQSGRLRTGLVEEEEEETDLFNSIGSWEESGGLDSFDFGADFGSGLNNFSSDTSDKLYNPRGYSVEEMGTLKMLFQAPIHALQQTADAVINTKKVNKKTRVKIAKDWRVVGLALGIFSFLGFLPFITSFIYFPVGIALILSSAFADYYYGNNGGDSIIERLVNAGEDDFSEGEQEEGLDSETSEESGGEEFGLGSGDSGLSGFGGFGGFDGFEDTAGSLEDRYSGSEMDDEEDSEAGEEYYDPEENGALATDFFPESPIETDNTEMFREGLLDVYKSGLNTRGKMLYRRQDMIKYYAKYMPNNDKAFARWTTIREHSPEYDNVAYTIYKSLVSIDGKFDMKNAVPNKDKLTVIDMKRTPLIYKITVKLPSYFKINSVTRQANVFNDMLKASDDDEKVGTIMTTFGGDLVIKFLRLDYKKLVSMGDLLRLSSETDTESFAEKFATSKGVPMVAGMRDNEYPYMVDIVANPAASIVGGSGSGKSWLTFQFMDSMLMANSPEHLNFIILDAKDAAIWKQFALAPHVLGYHSDYHDFIDVLMEVKAEHQRRMNLLSDLGIESWKDYNSRCMRNGEYDKLAEMPLMFVIVDEITFTMSSLQNEDEAMYKELKNLLTQLSSVIRASGIRMMLIGQRAIDTSIPKGYLANSPLKLGMKMNVQADFTTMLGKGYENQVSRIPSGPGEGIMLAEGQTKSSYVKTVIPGGKDDGDILMQVRVLALDWARRTQGTRYDYTTIYNDMRTTIKKGFNRETYYNQALLAIEEGRITDPKRPDEKYLLSVNSPNAPVIDNAIENVERKLEKVYDGNKNSSAVMGVYEDTEVDLEDGLLETSDDAFPSIDSVNWDEIVSEPEEVEEPDSIEDSELYAEEPLVAFDEPEEVDEPEELEDLNVPSEPEWAVGMEENEGAERNIKEFSIEDYGREDEVSEVEDVFTGNTAYSQPDGVSDDTQEQYVDWMDMTLDEMMAEDEKDKEQHSGEKEYASTKDIETMLDVARDTVNVDGEDDLEPEEDSEEVLKLRREQEELEEARVQQQKMLDMLHKQQEEREFQEKEEALKREEARKKEELRKKKELERQKKIKEEQERLAKQKADLEKQKQEILRLQQQLSSEKPDSEEEKTVQKEQKSTGTINDKVSVKKVEKDVTTPEPEPKPEPKSSEVVKEAPKTKVSRGKPVRKRVSSPVKEKPANTVGYNEMDNMSVSQYIAKYGIVVSGERRVEASVIKAKFNRRKISLAMAIGEVYEKDEYFYYSG